MMINFLQLFGGQIFIQCIGQLYAFNGFEVYSDISLITPLLSQAPDDPSIMPIPITDADIGILSQDVINIEGGNLTATRSIYLLGRSPTSSNGQLRLANTDMNSSMSVLLECDGDLYYTGQSYVVGK